MYMLTTDTVLHLTPKMSVAQLAKHSNITVLPYYKLQTANLI